MREYNKVGGIRSDRHMTSKEIITAADNLREVERVAKNGTYGRTANAIITGICILGLVIFYVVPLIMYIFE